MSNTPTDTPAPVIDADAGDVVRIEYTADFQARPGSVEGVVTPDHYDHRPTPEGALDVRVHGDSGARIVRVEFSEIVGAHRVRAVDPVSKRHDHLIGTLDDVARVDEPEDDEDEPEGEGEVPVVVDRWEWADTVDHMIVLHGFDAADEHVATRMFGFVSTDARVGDDEWRTVESAANGDDPSWSRGVAL